MRTFTKIVLFIKEKYFLCKIFSLYCLHKLINWTGNVFIILYIRRKSIKWTSLKSLTFSSLFFTSLLLSWNTWDFNERWILSSFQCIIVRKANEDRHSIKCSSIVLLICQFGRDGARRLVQTSQSNIFATSYPTGLYDSSLR